MGQWQFHTPDGVMDYLPEDCRTKRRLENIIRRVFDRRGYEEIETPGIEFFDVYSGEGNFTSQENLFKFFDHKGRILCLRYDGTIPAARLAATVYKDARLPLRLSYLGNMYRFNESGGGRQREFTQAGLELLGCSSAEADAEIIAAAIESAQALGINDLQVSIGQVGFFKGLLDQWQVSEDQARLLPQLIDTRESVALDEIADQLGLDQKARTILAIITGHNGSIETVDQLLEMVEYPVCRESLQNLKAVLAVLEDYNLMRYVSIDLGMLQSINYYTGIIFKGFTYGLGFPLFSGGRYDKVVSSFGRDLAATGFSIGINFVMAALRRQGQPSAGIDTLIRLVYESGQRERALKLAEKWRENGMKVICESIHDANIAELVLEEISGDPTDILISGAAALESSGGILVVKLGRSGSIAMYRSKEKLK